MESDSTPPKLCLSGMQRGRKMLRQFLKLSADMSVGSLRFELLAGSLEHAAVFEGCRVPLWVVL